MKITKEAEKYTRNLDIRRAGVENYISKEQEKLEVSFLERIFRVLLVIIAIVVGVGLGGILINSIFK
jgi:hypothetical protein